MTSTPSPLQIRAARIAQLRRRVAATAVATFALAVGAVAHDGSMGRTPASAATPATPAVTHASADTTSPADAAPSPADDVVSTRQS
jgi:hypothetical protein